jgi:hypothetical protein
MKKSQRGYAPIFLIVIVVIALGTTMYFLSHKDTLQTAIVSDTKEWKTYTNTKYGFEFKYPANLSVYNTTSHGEATGLEDAITVSDLDAYNMNKAFTLTISTQPNTAAAGVDEQLKNSQKVYPSDRVFLFSTLNNDKALHIYFENGASQFIFYRPSAIITFTDTSITPNYDAARDIVSTLVFKEQ